VVGDRQASNDEMGMRDGLRCIRTRCFAGWERSVSPEGGSRELELKKQTEGRGWQHPPKEKKKLRSLRGGGRQGASQNLQKKGNTL